MATLALVARRRFLCTALAVASTASLSASLLPAVATASPADPTTSPTPAPISSTTTSVHADVPRAVVYRPVLSAGEVAWYTNVLAFDAGTATAPSRPAHLSFTRHRDFRPAIEPGGFTSTDGGLNWTSAPVVPGLATATKRDDGKVLDLTVSDGEDTSTIVDADTRRVFVRTSPDGGTTFGPLTEAMIDIAPEVFAPSAGIYPNNMITGPDGVLYLAAYASLPATGGSSLSALLLKSTDGGTSWQLHSVIARGTLAEGQFRYTETAIAFDVNGSLLAVIRNCQNVRNVETGALICNYVPFQSARLADVSDPQSRWSAATTIDAPGYPSMIQPRLQLLPNGVLALLGGRQDTWLAISPDGTGNAWQSPTLVYRNAVLDSDGNPLPYPGTINEGSSGNSGFAWVAANRVVAAADTCHAIYAFGSDTDKCLWRSHIYTLSDTSRQAIVRKHLDILTPGSGKLDLAGKVRARTATITVANEYKTAARPRLDARGAFDGSTETWSSAATAGGPGSYTIMLDRQYRLNRIGLSQWIGRHQSARVEVATNPDGPWTTWWDAGDQRSFAMTYSPASLPAVDARYVRVVTPGSADCPTGMTAPCSMLNEIELYAADTQTFENDPLYASPRDYRRSETGVFTTDINTASGGRVLRLSDAASDTRQTWVARDAAPSPTRTLRFAFRPDLAGFDENVDGDRFIFSLQGIRGGKTAEAYTLAITDQGAVQEYVKRAWRTVAPAGTVPGTGMGVERWSTVEVAATTRGAVLQVNGATVATVSPAQNVASLTAHTFACDTGAAVDDQTFFIDDIEYRN